MQYRPKALICTRTTTTTLLKRAYFLRLIFQFHGLFFWVNPIRAPLVTSEVKNSLSPQISRSANEASFRLRSVWAVQHHPCNHSRLGHGMGFPILLTDVVVQNLLYIGHQEEQEKCFRNFGVNCFRISKLLSQLPYKLWWSNTQEKIY